MGFSSWLGGLIDPSDQAAAQAGNAAIDQTLAGNSPYWNAAHLNGDDASIVQGAAGLANTNIGYDSSNVDQDAAAQQALAGIYAGIAKNGGQLTQAVQHQAASDLANTAVSKLNKADREQAANVLGQDSAERNWAASGATGSRAKAAAAALQKQVWNTAVSHANFEAQLAGHGIINEDKNLAGALAMAMSEGAQSARNAQKGANRAQSAADFANAMGVLQAGAGAISAGASTISGMGSLGSDGSGNAASGADSGTTYSSSGAVLGSNFNSGVGQSTQTGDYSNISTSAMPLTTSKYVNPITGNAVDSNLPDENAWGDWLINGSTLASA